MTTDGSSGPATRPVGAALRRLAHELGTSRADARRLLDQAARHQRRDPAALAADIADGTIRCSAVARSAPTSGPEGAATVPRQRSEVIRRRVERQYVVLRVDEPLDADAARTIEATLASDTANADVVVDLRDCPSTTADGLAVLRRAGHALERHGSTLTLRSPTAPDPTAAPSA